MSVTFDFGIEADFPESEITPRGKVLCTSEAQFSARPYLVLFDESKPHPAELDHFLSRPFSGHSWNHYLLYWLQDYPIGLARSFAYFHLSGRQELPQTEFVDADADSILLLVDKLKEFRPFYESLLGAGGAAAFSDDCRRLLAARRVFAEIEITRQARRTWKKSIMQAATPLDETYLHLSFMQSAFQAVLDALLLNDLQLDRHQIIDDRLYDNPIYKRLRGKKLQKVVDFLSAWHRQSYKLPPFAKRFIRSFCRTSLRKA